MIVRTPRIDLDRTLARLTARVESDAGAFAPTTITFSVPRSHVGWLDASGNPWVPTCLLIAARLHERLVVEAPVSSRLLAGATAVAGWWNDWWDLPVPHIEAEAAPVSPQPAGPETVACFTRGVDSWFTALRATSPGAAVPATGLVYLPDLDRQYSPPTRRRAVRRTQEAAATLGLPLLVVGFDGRDLIDRFVIWDDVFGSVLAGVALALGGEVGRFLLPSTHDLRHLAAHGSHPDVDPLWSTERTAILHDGAETTRARKVGVIATRPHVLSQLKVCWEVDTDTNCGRCKKCMRTMIELQVAGVRGHADCFAEPFSLDAFTALPPPRTDRRRALFAEAYDAFPDDPSLHELREALRARLGSWHPAAPHRPAPPPGVRIQVEVAHGMAVQLARPLARGILPGPLVDANAARDADVRRLTVTWTRAPHAGVALPWRPPAAEREHVLAACRAPAPRPVSWCILDHPTAASAEVVRDLTAAWGPGLVCLPHRAAPDCDHGTPRAVAASVMRRATIRAWRGDVTGLDPFRTLEALRHGCLPLQCVGEDEHDALAEVLPAGLMAFVAPLRRDVLARLDVGARLARGLSVVMAGSLERDLHLALARLATTPS